MFSLIGTIIIGFVVGLIARAIKPGNDKLGLIMTSILGIAGAFLANFIGQKMGWYAPGQPAGWIASVVGAMILLFIYGLVKSKT
ncbi:MAG: transglycosylase [Rhodoferax sp.]|nr:transglycosylase [Rhodoferax sp.]